MNLVALYRAFDAVMTLRDLAKRWKSDEPETGLTHPVAPPGLTGQIETRLTNVVVAALKEAFDRDHARLELEREQLDEQRRRAEEAMRLELRRQAVDRETGRLRLLAGTALVGWIASVALLVARLGAASVASRGMLAAAWVLLLGSLAAAFQAQRRISGSMAEGNQPPDAGHTGDAALWLLVSGLAMAAISLMF